MIVDNAATAVSLIAPYFEERAGNRVAVLHLDEDGHLLATTFCESLGPTGELPLRDILTAALRFGSAALIVALNRAGGETDLEETRRLADAAAAAGVRLADRLVFAEGEWRSLRGLGLL
jgi:DNA repair protein RadC